MASSSGEATSRTDPTRRESSWVVIGLFAIAASTLLVEITLTKFIAYKVYHHYAYAVISIVIFSFGAAGAYVFIRPEVYDNPERPGWPRASS